jgi:hypothetical protein
VYKLRIVRVRDRDKPIKKRFLTPRSTTVKIVGGVYTLSDSLNPLKIDGTLNIDKIERIVLLISSESYLFMCVHVEENRRLETKTHYVPQAEDE